MYTTFEVFHTEDTYLNIKGNDGKIRFIPTKVYYAMVPDDINPDFDYGNELENEREMKRFKSGELLNLCLKVTVTALGEYGVDSLGHCFVSSKDIKNQLLQIASEYDMKNVACIELKNNIELEYKILKEALEGQKYL